MIFLVLSEAGKNVSGGGEMGGDCSKVWKRRRDAPKCRESPTCGTFSKVWKGFLQGLEEAGVFLRVRKSRVGFLTQGVL